MRVAADKKNFSLNKALIEDLNSSLKNFSNKRYSRIEKIDGMLIRRDISVEKKKKILIGALHESVVAAFSIDKKKFTKRSLDSLRDRLHSIRKLIDKLRSINHYLETAFLEDIMLPKANAGKSQKLRRESIVARDELEALEYGAYKMIEHAVMLDKTALKEYKLKEISTARKETGEAESLKIILSRESSIMEHLEAKLPPRKAVSAAFVKEPIFTHWVARIFALLSYLEELYSKEAKIFNKLKNNNAARRGISKKIMQIIKEKSKLLRIMEEKSISMKKLRIDNNFRKELRNFTTVINI